MYVLKLTACATWGSSRAFDFVPPLRDFFSFSERKEGCDKIISYIPAFRQNDGGQVAGMTTQVSGYSPNKE